ncbi:MAG: T9SS type A sorting domain-containing protein, partial [Hymenobacter sp.]
SLTVPQDASLLSVLPHSHLLAKKWKIWAVKPSGDTIKLAKIDSWNFRWQGNYRFLAMQKLPAGSRLEADVTYDNTMANPRQPNSPPQTVQWGENTTDEMLLSYFDLVPYLPGDEAIALATRAVVPVGAAADDDFLLHPNPAELGSATASFTLAKAGPVSLRLLDQNGRLVRTVLTNQNQSGGAHQVALPLQELAAGLYLVQLETEGRVRVGKLLVQ